MQWSPSLPSGWTCLKGNLPCHSRPAIEFDKEEKKGGDPDGAPNGLPWGHPSPAPLHSPRCRNLTLSLLLLKQRRCNPCLLRCWSHHNKHPPPPSTFTKPNLFFMMLDMPSKKFDNCSRIYSLNVSPRHRPNFWMCLSDHPARDKAFAPPILNK